MLIVVKVMFANICHNNINQQFLVSVVTILVYFFIADSNKMQ